MNGPRQDAVHYAREALAPARTQRLRWHDVLRADPEPPRQLTLHELQRLTRLGFPNLALAHARGTCPDCGLNRAGTGHHQLCVEPEQKRNPEPAPSKARQPWEPRPARRAA
jgi:hypothetical protein